MPERSNKNRPLPRRFAAVSSTRAKPAAIDAARDRLVAETQMLDRLEGASAKTLKTARLLLTRLWAKADWRRREELLRAADWLIRAETSRCAPQIARPR
jgi:hypothetical protein